MEGGALAAVVGKWETVVQTEVAPSGRTTDWWEGGRRRSRFGLLKTGVSSFPDGIERKRLDLLGLEVGEKVRV